jgi:hypothetical protein
MIHQRLALAKAPTPGLSTLMTCLRSQNISITTLEEEQNRTTDWLAKILNLLRATGPERVDNPYCVGTDTDFWSKEGAANVWESSHLLNSDAVFLAVHNDQYVGLSFLAEEMLLTG